MANRAESSGFIGLRRGKPYIFFDRPPGQQPRLLEHHADPCAGRTRNASQIVGVKAGENPQHRALAAAGGTDEDADLSGLERKGDAGEHVVLSARRAPEGLAGDIDLKPHGDATAMPGLQTAAPARFR